MKNIINKLLIIQKELKAPKNQRNNFGNYNYRSCEDILEAVKPLLNKEGLVLCISDDIINIGGYNYIQATAILYFEDEKIETKALAKEPLEQKGMSSSQITGASSSYARKYALNGLFAIDDEKDSDSTNTHGKETKKEVKTETKAKAKISYDSGCPDCGVICENITKGTTKEGKAYEMGTCECGTKFFINRK